MCAIVDANVGGDVFGERSTAAGSYFRDWLSKGKGKLVVGGLLLDELSSSLRFRRWYEENVLAGRVIQPSRSDIEDHEVRIRMRGNHRSDDEHVLALASASGARLLFTKDSALMDDFRDAEILSQPGRIYTTHRSEAVTSTHKRLLSRADICTLPG